MSLYKLQNCVLLLYLNIFLLSFCIFRERNRCLFEDIESNVLRLKLSFLNSLLDWASFPKFSSLNLVDLVHFLDFRHH
jgi:hypothetical protein